MGRERIAQASSFSRGTSSSEVCCVPSQPMRGAERRQALGCSGTRRRASDVGPQALARRLAFQRERSPLGAPPRRLLVPDPPWRNLRALHMSGALGSRIGAFARSARSGGRAVLPDASRGRGYEPRAQDAASRSDSGSSPETPSVNGTARIIHPSASF